jgi:GAF domain-containing protein
MTPAPLLVLTPDLVVVEANHAYLSAVRRRREELVGRYVFDAFPVPDDPEGDGTAKARASMLRALETGRTDTMALQRYDIPARGGGFERRYWSPIHVPIMDGRGRVVLLLHRAVDVTDFVVTRQRAQDGRGHDGGAQDKRAPGERAGEDAPALYALAHELAAAVQAQQVASRRLSSLADVTMQLGSAESVKDLADIVFGAALPVLEATGGSIAVRDPHSDTLQVTVTPSLGGAMQRAYARMPLHGPMPTSVAARTGETVLVPDEQAAARYEGLSAAFEMSSTRAVAVLPLRVGERLLGSIAIGFGDPQEFRAEDVELLRVFASQCAQVLDRLQVRDAERKAALEVARIAETLQRSLLTAPPAREGLVFEVVYQPAQEAAQVGGDWYDAFPNGSGGTMIVIGDVAGHDQDAAATMAQVRNLLRGIAQTLGRLPPPPSCRRWTRALDRLGVPVLASIVLAEISPPAPEHPGPDPALVQRGAPSAPAPARRRDSRALDRRPGPCRRDRHRPGTGRPPDDPAAG